jgi:PhnB protein
MSETNVTPYLCVKDGAAALDFYQRVLGAKETMRLTGDDGRIGHAEFSVGDAVLMLSDEHPEINVVSPTTLGNTPVALHLLLADVDAVYERAQAAGVQIERAPQNEVYGERTFIMRDPFGHRWFVATKVEDLSAGEMKARFEAEGYTTTVDG